MTPRTSAQIPLPGILRAHRLWLENPAEGCPADLSGVTLNDRDLSGVDLRRAILNGVTLLDSNLAGADLSAARLYRADLQRANLASAD